MARFAAAAFEGRCAELGLEAARLLLLLYHTLVDSTLSYCAAVWAPGLALTAVWRAILGGRRVSDAERQHHHTLRRLLGLPQRAPTATILAEAGEVPLYITWLVSAPAAAGAPHGDSCGTARWRRHRTACWDGRYRRPGASQPRAPRSRGWERPSSHGQHSCNVPCRPPV